MGMLIVGTWYLVFITWYLVCCCKILTSLTCLTPLTLPSPPMLRQNSLVSGLWVLVSWYLVFRI